MNSVARDPAELMAECQGLVRSVAIQIRRKLPAHVELDELIADGQIGLAQAARDFDPEHGARFATYAYYRIRGAIYDGISQLSWTPSARHRLRYAQLSNEAMQESPAPGTATDPRAAARRPDGATGDWFGQATARLAIVYLGAMVGEEGGGFEAVDEKTPNPAVAFDQQELAGQLRQLIEELEEPLRTLINGVYFEGLTIQQAGTQLGMSKSWASRLHSRALDHMARSLRRIGGS